MSDATSRRRSAKNERLTQVDRELAQPIREQARIVAQLRKRDDSPALEAELTQIEAEVARVRVSPMVFQSGKAAVICPRVRVNVPRVSVHVPVVHVPAPVVDVEMSGNGPI